MLAEKHIQEAIILLATIDPIGTLLVFVAITAGRSAPRGIAWHPKQCFWPEPSFSSPSLLARSFSPPSGSYDLCRME